MPRTRSKKAKKKIAKKRTAKKKTATAKEKATEKKATEKKATEKKATKKKATKKKATKKKATKKKATKKKAARKVAAHHGIVDADGLPPWPVDAAVTPEEQQQALDFVTQELAAQPSLALRWAREAFDPGLTHAGFLAALARARAPEVEIAAEPAAFFAEEERSVPDDFTFPGYDPATIPIDPTNTDFETAADAVNWATSYAVARWRNRNEIVPFRWADNYSDRFRYQVPAADENDIRLALFADFGTGLYHSRYIAKHLGEEGLDAAVHLGDIYYAGTWNETNRSYNDPLIRDLVRTTPFFCMNSNHEMYSKGIPYFAYLDRKRSLNVAQQPQRGSYFCLQFPRYQVVGIDTAHPTDGRHKEADLQVWLRSVLREGKLQGKANILLSPNEGLHLPRKFFSGGGFSAGDSTGLFEKDLQGLIEERLIDLWFWGNVHYAALYEPRTSFPIVSSCIGHAGYAYERITKDEITSDGQKWVAWHEDLARFPAWTKLRQDMGNNGYCVLSLRPDGAYLTYKDWMRRTRCEAVVKRDGPNLRRAVEVLAIHAETDQDCRQ